MYVLFYVIIVIYMSCIAIIQGDFFYWSRPKSSKCWRWQNPYQKSESKGMSPRKCENLTKTFTFLVGTLQSPTLRTFRAGPVKKITLYKVKIVLKTSVKVF